MGMYTAFVFNARLKDSVPDTVLQVLGHMTGGDSYWGVLPNHPLFQTQRWDFMLRCDSAYFPLGGCAQLETDDFAQGQTLLHVRSSFKNYHGEIDKFLDWIEPYTEAAVGYHQYEEADAPTWIQLGDGSPTYTDPA